MCVLQKNAGLNPRAKRYPRCGQPSAAVSIHMCVPENKFKVAPKDQRLHGIGRPTAAVSIHMCVAEYINSGLHLSVKGYNGLAVQLLLREHTCDMCVAEKINSGLVWSTTAQGLGRPAAASIRTHVCCRATQFKAPPKDHG